MGLLTIFKKSFTYPSNDWNKLLILGLLFIIANFINILRFIGVNLDSIGFAEIILAILLVIGIIIDLFIVGYAVTLIKFSSNNLNIFPEFKPRKNIFEGLIAVIISIIYSIIPFIITLLLVFVTGVFDKLMQVMANTRVSTTELMNSLIISTSIVLIVAIVLFIIFSMISIIAIARFADKETMSAAFQFKQILNIINKIGLGKYIIWYILLLVILGVIMIISGLINLIPLIGIIISTFLIYPYILLFLSRAIGLIYFQKKKEI